MTYKSGHSASATEKCKRDLRYYYIEGDDLGKENVDGKCNSESMLK